MGTRIAIMLGCWSLFLFFGGIALMIENDITSWRRARPISWYGHGKIYTGLGVFIASVIPFFVPS